MDMNMDVLIDKKFNRVWTKATEDGEKYALVLEGDDGSYVLEHSQDCCEHVYIEDIVVSSMYDGLECLINTPILSAERVTSDNITPAGITEPERDDSFTWTFFKLTTLKGYVDIRFFGSSNGYYSEDATLSEYEPD
jgi:hypothetical protein